MEDLTADEVHVLLDVIGTTPKPWTQYDEGEDPKATKRGWTDLLTSAEAKLTARLDAL